MHINEVSSLVGLTKKSIRYYEEEGLLKPIRANNSYRKYDEEDIKVLKTIKFLRELNVPINEIKKLKNNELTLEECLKERIKIIENAEKNYQTIKNMCNEIINNKDTYNDIEPTKYIKVLNVLGKKGFTIKDVSKTHKEKILGAVLSSFFFSFLFIFVIAIITYFQVTESEKIPWIVYWFLIFILATPVIGIVVNLIKRILEIKGGEEDEASKY